MTSSPGERDYRFIALGGLLVIFVLLIDEGLGWWATIPLGAGVMGILVPGSISPAFILSLLVVLLALRGWFVGLLIVTLDETGPVSVLIFAVATLAYVGGHVRLLAIQRHAIPPDVRRERAVRHERIRGRWLLPSEPTRRSSLLPSGEILTFLLSLPAFALVAYLLWLRLTLSPPPPDFEVPVAVWRVLVLLWAAMLALGGSIALTSYFRRSLANREESLSYLQDQLWAATRGEQRRIHGWDVWARLRKERKENHP